PRCDIVPPHQTHGGSSAVRLAVALEVVLALDGDLATSAVVWLRRVGVWVVDPLVGPGTTFGAGLPLVDQPPHGFVAVGVQPLRVGRPDDPPEEHGLRDPVRARVLHLQGELRVADQSFPAAADGVRKLMFTAELNRVFNSPGASPPSLTSSSQSASDKGSSPSAGTTTAASSAGRNVAVFHDAPTLDCSSVAGCRSTRASHSAGERARNVTCSHSHPSRRDWAVSSRSRSADKSW